MRTLVPQQPESPNRAKAQNGSQAIVRRRPCIAARRLPERLAASAAFFAAQFVFGFALAAQTPATPAPAPAHAAAHRHKKPAAAKHAAQPAPAPAPVAPPLPNWPANHKPAEATVVWDSHGLFIQASNSSLDQILRDVALKTGAKVEGMGEDERVFGTYGPGPARDVLTQLLDGSGYNILLVGDLGQGTPRRIVLSGHPVPGHASGNANPGAANNDAENEQEGEQPEINPPGQPAMLPPVENSVPAVPARTPQQLLEQRQQQMQQMQQQQQNNPPRPQN